MAPRKVVYEGPERRYSGPDRRGGESDGVYVGLPVWVRAIALIGFPTVIACFLIWMGAKYLPTMQAEITAMKIIDAQNHEVYQQQIEQARETYRLLQKMCSILAKSEDERQKCFDR